MDDALDDRDELALLPLDDSTDDALDPLLLLDDCELEPLELLRELLELDELLRELDDDEHEQSHPASSTLIGRHSPLICVTIT